MLYILQYALQDKDYVPVVLMHGVNGNPGHMSKIKSWIEEAYPGQYVYISKITPQESNLPIIKQAHMLQEELKADPRFSRGFIALGKSQGGYVMRSYTQMVNDPPVVRLVTLASPVAGMYTPDYVGWCKEMEKGYYTEEAYQKCSFSGWFQDPEDYDNFAQQNRDLAYLDNVRDYDEKRRQNMINLDRLVLVGSQVDEAIKPWESQFFGFHTPYSRNKTQSYWQRDVYTKIGLDVLDQQNKIYQIHSLNKHMENLDNKEFFVNHVVKHFDVEFE